MKRPRVYVHEASKAIGRSADTLRLWDRCGKLVAYRDEHGYRYYTAGLIKMGLRLVKKK